MLMVVFFSVSFPLLASSFESDVFIVLIATLYVISSWMIVPSVPTFLVGALRYHGRWIDSV